MLESSSAPFSQSSSAVLFVYGLVQLHIQSSSRCSLLRSITSSRPRIAVLARRLGYRDPWRNTASSADSLQPFGGSYGSPWPVDAYVYGVMPERCSVMLSAPHRRSSSSGSSTSAAATPPAAFIRSTISACFLPFALCFDNSL